MEMTEVMLLLHEKCTLLLGTGLRGWRELNKP